MRLSEWRASAPTKDAAGPKVAAVVDPVLTALGAGPDPHCWIAWGEEPANRYTIFVPTDPGLISAFLRTNVAGEGPRATTKLIRWNRVTIGELSVDTQGGHRMLSFQLESQVIRGVDAEADRAAEFAIRLIAAIDGRPLPPTVETKGRSRTGTKPAAKASPATVGGAKPAAAKRPAAAGAPIPRLTDGRAKAASNAKR